MTDLDLDKLEADAQAATPGPWKVDGVWIEAGLRDVIAPGEVACSSSCLGGSSRITGDNFEADYRHVANMDPTTTGVLIEELRVGRKRLGRIYKLHSSSLLRLIDGREREFCRECNLPFPCRTLQVFMEES